MAALRFSVPLGAVLLTALGILVLARVALYLRAEASFLAASRRRPNRRD